jgi:hypothetical protein
VLRVVSLLRFSRYLQCRLHYSMFTVNTQPLDITRRSSAGSIASAPTPTHSFPPPIPAFNRAEMFSSLRPMASTESLNLSMNSKRTFSPSQPMWVPCRNPTAFSQLGTGATSAPLADSTFSPYLPCRALIFTCNTVACEI